MANQNNLIPTFLIAAIAGGISGTIASTAATDIQKRVKDSEIAAAGMKGDRGLSAYQLWLLKGNIGTVSDFLEASRGKSAYEIWLEIGNTGTKEDFLNSLIGVDGASGPTGATGDRGLSILSGNFNPNASNGVDGEFWINTFTYEIWGPKEFGAWPPSGVSLVGPQGPQGFSVLHGTVNPTTQGVNNDFFINLSTYEIFGPKEFDAWPTPGTSLIGPQGIQGIQGVDGKSLLYGPVDPTTEGNDDDFYLNTTSFYLFGPKAGTWPAGTSLVGPQGADGRTLLNGTVNPTTEGTNGDFYINTTTNEIWGPKSGGSWAGTNVSIVGPRGFSVLNGAVDPTPGDGEDGEFWINTTTYDIFGPKSGGTWPSGISLIGPQGPQGLNILNGNVNPTVGDGLNGEFWLNTSTYELWGPKVAGAWPGSGVRLKGNTILNGTVNPTTEGVSGDFYINTVTNYLWGPKTTVWPSPPVQLKGNTILSGTVDPTPGDGVDGDFWINTATNEIFGPKSGGTWPAPQPLTGPTPATFFYTYTNSTPVGAAEFNYNSTTKLLQLSATDGSLNDFTNFFTRNSSGNVSFTSTNNQNKIVFILHEWTASVPPPGVIYMEAFYAYDIDNAGATVPFGYGAQTFTNGTTWTIGKETFSRFFTFNFVDNAINTPTVNIGNPPITNTNPADWTPIYNPTSGGFFITNCPSDWEKQVMGSHVQFKYTGENAWYTWRYSFNFAPGGSTANFYFQVWEDDGVTPIPIGFKRYARANNGVYIELTAVGLYQFKKNYIYTVRVASNRTSGIAITNADLSADSL